MTKPMSSAAAAAGVVDHHGSKPSRESKGEYTPIAVVFGMVVAALAIGAHTAKQQLVHSPGVWVNKKKRESIPEVEMLDQVAGQAGRFVDKSFLRKVAHIQDSDAARFASDPFNTYDRSPSFPPSNYYVSLSLILLLWMQATIYGELEVRWG
ncbi:hypothetical protein B296_00013355 [Ensete ventricosum]|uniref:Uncharacterized protein n=1 Tax=Ensete ventricosum TaxID=4639 RepID=A0A427ACY2_ENSVE|nr:hypothetical protein B296_00013355 [Ensete ventricosum]